MIMIDFKKGLSKVWEDFNAQELQAQTGKSRPNAPKVGFYAGPCAIGAMMTPEEQHQLDHSPYGGGETYAGIGILVFRARVGFTDSDAVGDAATLQLAHDNWLARPSLDSLNRFVLTLSELSTKYGVEFPIPEATAS